MIYLIDDNQNNQRVENYNLTFVDDGDFKKNLTAIERLEYRKDLNDSSHLDFLSNADCILLHSTTEDYDEVRGFLSGLKTNSLKIQENISRDGEIIPLVLFSNSMGEAEYDYKSNPYFIRSIKKNLFYDRLYDFMKHYEETKEVELRILAWGKNYEIQEIRKNAMTILSSIAIKSDSDKIELTDLSLVLDSMKFFLKVSLPETDMNSFFEQLEDDPLSAGDFKKNIKKITESYSKYGKNIHSWEW